MDEQEREIAYWLSKLLVMNLQENKLISVAEMKQIQKKILSKYKPIIGSLDGDEIGKRNNNN